MHGVSIPCFSFLMTSDPLPVVPLPPSHPSSEVSRRSDSVLPRAALDATPLLGTFAMGPGASFLSPGPCVPPCRQTQVVPPCVLTGPHLCFAPRPDIVSKRSAYESICTLDCALLEGRKLCLYLCTHGTR